VALVGNADLKYWEEHLRPKGLFPLEKDGHAEIILSAMSLEWKGVRFSEWVASVFIREGKNANTHRGYYLIQAFNSFRLFAFCEKVFFSTPYDFGTITVDQRSPSSMELKIHDEIVIKATMSKSSAPVSSVYEDWSGPIYLPSGSLSEPLYFMARMRDEAQYFPFSDQCDTLSINASKDYPVFEWLLRSEFLAEKWSVVSSAVHSRSKTFKGKEWSATSA
jgi:hypothetical protein